MKKVCIFILSLVCCFALAACIGGGNNDTPKNNDNVFLVDKEITVYVGGTYKFEPTGAESFAYTSSDESVAKVSADGLLTGIADGTAFVDVSAGEVSVTCKVNVIKAENYIRLNQTGVTTAVGSDVILKAEVISGGKVSADEVKFDKGEADGITVKQNGVNSAIISVTKTGSYVITVSCGTLKAECAVKAVNVTAITLETPIVSVENCKTVKWNAVEHAGAYMYSVNGDEWVKTAQTSFNAQEITDRLKYKDKVVFAVKALAGENDFDYIDGLPAAIDFSHEYVATTIEEYTCSKAGKVSFKCSVCDKEYLDENYLADHVMENGACVNCGLLQTKKVVYRYDEKNDCYFVVGADAGYDSEDLYILAKYNDGINGERPVKYIGYGAFAANKTIKRVVLPESMTEFVDADNKYNKTDKNGVKVSSPLRGTVFDDCSNLEFVSMKGVTVLRDVADASYSHWNFRDCYNLKQVIVADGFDNYGATFMRWVNTPDKSENQTDIYVFGNKITKLCNDSYPIGYDNGFGNNTLLTGDVFYYDENSTDCYKWHFAADGISVVTSGKHVFNNKNKCKKCGAMNDFGVNYGYYEGKDIDNKTVIKTYYVADNRTLNQSEIVILDEYTDGVHGTLPVTFVKNQAFAGNPKIKKVTLSENITRLDGGVFMLCENLEYVSMTGITDMEYINVSNKLFYGAGVDTGNNFLDCYKLKTLVVNEKFNLYKDAAAQQFLGRGSGVVAKIDLYSIGSAESSNINAIPNGKNNLLTGIVFYKGSLDKCRRWTEDDGVIEASAKDHDFVNGVCSICGEKDAMGVIYQYDEKYGVYYVAGYTGTGETLNVFGTWNDGKNGEKDVKYVAARAFQSKNTLKKVVLDAKIESLEGWVFAGCENLEYVSMVGVTNLEWASPYDGDGRDHNFRDCFKLKTLIAGNSFKTNCGQFGSGGTIANPVLDLYVYGNGAPSLTSTANDAYNLWTKKVYYYSAEQKSGCWYYDANGNAALWG